MEPLAYYCPWCKWSGPKAKEEGYSVLEHGKLTNAYRYLCPACGMDVFLDTDPEAQPRRRPRRPWRTPRLTEIGRADEPPAPGA